MLVALLGYNRMLWEQEVIKFHLQRQKLLLLSALEQRATAVGRGKFGKFDFFLNLASNRPQESQAEAWGKALWSLTGSPALAFVM